MEGNPSDEIILAEEEAVINHGVGAVQEAESDMDVGKQTEGNLVLTNLRLIYAHGAEQEMDIPVGMPDPFGTLGKKKLFFSDVEELDNIPSDPFNIMIRISEITSIKGHRRPGFAPKIEVRWSTGGIDKKTEFIEQETGRSRRKNLNDWVQIIQRLKTGTQKITILPPPRTETRWREGSSSSSTICRRRGCSRSRVRSRKSSRQTSIQTRSRRRARSSSPRGTSGRPPRPMKTRSTSRSLPSVGTT